MSGTVITFYSYKGGVGRTLALANVGTLLSVWGYRVLCVDWDLEAPGLHRYFDRWLSAPAAEGLVELIAEQGAGKEADWRRRIQKVSFPQETANGASLEFLAAGHFDEQYVERLQVLNWDALYRDSHFGEWLEGLRATWKEEYDFILIDSRTGFTDLGGICTIQLPDILVLLFTASWQSLDGVLDVARRASERQGHLPFDRASLPCVPVPTRFEARFELEAAKEWLEIFATHLRPLYQDWLAADVEPRQLLDVLRLPYVPYWSFGEKMPVLDEGIRDPESLGFAFATLTALLAHGLDQTELLVAKRDEFVEAASHGVESAEMVASVGGVNAGSVASVAVGGNVAGNLIFHYAQQPWPSNEPDLRSAYLRSLVAGAQYLHLEGIDPAGVARGESRLSVEAIYTPLLTRFSEDGRFNLQSYSALAQLNFYPRLVLLGEPGSGKSTFVNFLTLCMAGEALGLAEFNLRRLAAPFPENTIESGKPQPWDHGALLPVRVVLREFAARTLPSPGEPATAQHLWRYIEADLAAAGLSEFSPLLRRHLLVEGGFLILDGLDEVPEAEGRRARMQEEILSFARSYNRCRVLVTCRTYAYRNQDWKLPGFAEAALAPFNDLQIRHFIQRWYAHVATVSGLNSVDANGRAELLLREIRDNERLQELAKSPLLLTLMASLHTWRGSLPEHREELYADAVDLLLNRWEMQRVVVAAHGQSMVRQPSFAEFLAVGKDMVRAALEELAFETQAEGTTDITESTLVSSLLALSRNREVRPALLMDYLSDRAGLLEPRGPGVYTFSHRVFQEYLAACHLTGESFPGGLATLARADPFRWREVLFLAGAKAARGARFAVWSLAEALCWREPDDGEVGLADIWGALFAGELAVESADLGRISLADQAKLERFRRWLVHLLGEDRLPATERCLAGRCLVRLGDPRPEVMTVDEMAFCQVPAGQFQMGSKAGDPVALPNELPSHIVEIPYGVRIGQYPVTVAQYREFVEASGYAPEEPNCLTGVQNHPVVQVSWHDAMAFCLWLTNRWRGSGRLRTAESAMLPSEAEWERAARGSDGRSYAWGEDADPERANFAATGIGSASPVGCFPGGASPFGCEEMCGNVWEWTRSLWGQRWEVPDFAYPYRLDDGRENLEASPETLRILRGGSYISSSRNGRATSRSGLPPGSRNDGTGFRVALIPSVGAS